MFFTAKMSSRLGSCAELSLTGRGHRKVAPFAFYAGLFTEVIWERPTMRVLGYFIGCCAAVLLLSVILEKRNAEVEMIPHVDEIPHVQDEVRPRVSGGPSKDVKQTVEIRLMRDQDWVEFCARDNPSGDDRDLRKGW